MRQREALALCYPGGVAERTGDLRAAAQYYREAVEIAREYDDGMFIWLGSVGLAQVAVRQGLPGRAARIFGAAALENEGRFWLRDSPDAIDEQRYDEALAAARAALGDD